MRRWGLVIVVMAVALQVVARPYSRDPKDFFVVEVGAGYGALLTSGSEIKPAEGAAVSLGIGYRYARNMLLVHVGLEGQYGYMTNRVNGIKDSTRMEQEGLEIVRHGEMYQRREAYRMVNMALPIAVGCDFGPIYFLAGLKPALSVWGETRAQAHVQAWRTAGNTYRHLCAIQWRSVRGNEMERPDIRTPRNRRTYSITQRELAESNSTQMGHLG